MMNSQSHNGENYRSHEKTTTAGNRESKTRQNNIQNPAHRRLSRRSSHLISRSSVQETVLPFFKYIFAFNFTNYVYEYNSSITWKRKSRQNQYDSYFERFNAEYWL